jgi:hypothetical protein
LGESQVVIDSNIISAVPDIFSVFGCKRFQLLYRGSRDGFEASAFHRRCDSHANTLTLISSTNKCIFGGYTPVTWSSRDGIASDATQKSFIFTIKNPHKLPAQIFKQRQEANAIENRGCWGPRFGGGWGCADLHIGNYPRSSTGGYSSLGRAYANGTELAGNEVLTGSEWFTVEEIEVFEVV